MILCIPRRIEFKQLELSDREWVEKSISEDGSIACEYSFASLYLWQNVSNAVFAQLDGCVIRKVYEDRTVRTYHYPIGAPVNRASAVRKLIEFAKKSGKDIYFHGLMDETLEELKNIVGEQHLKYWLSRENQNYILSTAETAEMKGQKIKNNRRLLSRFLENENWSVEKITKESMCLCMEFCDRWYLEQVKTESKNVETQIVKKGLELLEELGLEGFLLKLNDDIVAFTIGEQLQKDVYAGHFMKGLRGVTGSYQMMMYMLIKEIMDDYKYLNIEEDLGEEGLRTSKLDWNPQIVTNSYNAKTYISRTLIHKILRKLAYR